MKREIKIFKSFEEQEAYKIEQVRKTTPLERFRNLYYMQKLFSKFHPKEIKERKIIITRGFPLF